MLDMDLEEKLARYRNAACSWCSYGKELEFQGIDETDKVATGISYALRIYMT